MFCIAILYCLSVYFVYIPGCPDRAIFPNGNQLVYLFETPYAPSLKATQLCKVE